MRKIYYDTNKYLTLVDIWLLSGYTLKEITDHFKGELKSTAFIHQTLELAKALFIPKNSVHSFVYRIFLDERKAVSKGYIMISYKAYEMSTFMANLERNNLKLVTPYDAISNGEYLKALAFDNSQGSKESNGASDSMDA